MDVHNLGKTAYKDYDKLLDSPYFSFGISDKLLGKEYDYDIRDNNGSMDYERGRHFATLIGNVLRKYSREQLKELISLAVSVGYMN